MDEEKLIKKLEGIQRPDLSSATHQRQLKLVLVSAQRSSWIGILLVALPCLFLFGVILKYGFGVGSHLFSALEEKMADIDRSFFRFVPPLLLVGGPLIALALNLLAILHFRVEPSRRELQVTVKLKIINLLIIGICLFILGTIFMYLVAENGAPFPLRR
jgi:uncharacterized membrane protein YwaF